MLVHPGKWPATAASIKMDGAIDRGVQHPASLVVQDLIGRGQAAWIHGAEAGAAMQMLHQAVENVEQRVMMPGFPYEFANFVKMYHHTERQRGPAHSAVCRALGRCPNGARRTGHLKYPLSGDS
jgi:hypothetical protein